MAKITCKPIIKDVEGLTIHVDKDALITAKGYLQKERFNKEVSEDTLINGILGILHSFN